MAITIVTTYRVIQPHWKTGEKYIGWLNCTKCRAFTVSGNFPHTKCEFFCSKREHKNIPDCWIPQKKMSKRVSSKNKSKFSLISPGFLRLARRARSRSRPRRRRPTPRCRRRSRRRPSRGTRRRRRRSRRSRTWRRWRPWRGQNRSGNQREGNHY